MYLFFIITRYFKRINFTKTQFKKIKKKIYLNIKNSKSKCSKCLLTACKHLLNLNSAYEKQLVKNNFFFNFALFLFFCKYLTKILTFPNSNKFKKQDFYNNNIITNIFFRKV